MTCPHCGHPDLREYFHFVRREKDGGEVRRCPYCNGQFIVAPRPIIDTRKAQKRAP